MQTTLALAVPLTLGALLAAIPGQAQNRSFVTQDASLYWWIDAGATIPQDARITDFGGWVSDQKVDLDVGGTLDLGMGYAFNKYVAAEFQVGATWNSIASVDGAAIQDTYFGTAPIFANVVFQCPIPRTLVIPYVGAGVGGAATMFDTDGYYQNVPGGSVALYGSDSDFVFAWHGFAGVRVQFNETMSIGLSYHYLHVDPSEFSYGDCYCGQPDFEFGFSK